MLAPERHRAQLAGKLESSSLNPHPPMATILSPSPSNRSGPPSVPASLHARSPSSPTFDCRRPRSLASNVDTSEQYTYEQCLTLPLPSASVASSGSPCSTPRPGRNAQLMRERDGRGRSRRRSASFDYGRTATLETESSLTMSLLARRTRRPPNRSDQYFSTESAGAESSRRRSFGGLGSRTPRHISTEDRYASPEPRPQRPRFPPFVFPLTQVSSNTDRDSAPDTAPSRKSHDRRAWALTRSISSPSELSPSARRDAPVLQRPPSKWRSDRPNPRAENISLSKPQSADDFSSRPSTSSIVTNVPIACSTDGCSSASRDSVQCEDFSPADAHNDDETGSPVTSTSAIHVRNSSWREKRADVGLDENDTFMSLSGSGGHTVQRSASTSTEEDSQGLQSTMASEAAAPVRSTSTDVRRPQHIDIHPSLRQVSVDRDSVFYQAIRSSAFAATGHGMAPEHWTSSALSSPADEFPSMRTSGLTINTTDDIFSFIPPGRASAAATSAASLSSASVSSGTGRRTGEGLRVDQGGLMGSVDSGSDGGHFGPAIREKVCFLRST
jgi:hypothetical protein